MTMKTITFFNRITENNKKTLSAKAQKVNFITWLMNPFLNNPVYKNCEYTAMFSHIHCTYLFNSLFFTVAKHRYTSSK